MRIFHDPRCGGYSHPGHPERPARVTRSVEKLHEQTDLAITWSLPAPAEDVALLRAHSAEHLARLSEPEDFDMDTPYHPSIAELARLSAGGALASMKAAVAGETTFSLMRPPGHHATRNRAMGFCYLNNVAIACLEALACGVKRVGVFDFDVHHGNGTEAILLNRPAAVFASVHQHPCYPGTGTRNVGDTCFNYPVPPQTGRTEHRKILASALAQVLEAKPALLGISAGFDCYAEDPLAQLSLQAEDFYWLGQSIRKTGVPTFTVLEGGYSQDLPELILAYLKGIEGK